MIRYHEAHGQLPSRGRIRGGHRTVDEQDVRWLQNLQTPLTAAVTPATAVRALRGQLSGSERADIDRLSGNVPQSRQQLDSTVDAVEVPAEERISLAFDVFVMRTRIEPASRTAYARRVISGDFALLSLLAIEGQLTRAVLARLVGIAPSTLGARG
jgi:DNA-binding transcriptional MerR regulator